jgi:hypothetical protein
LLAGDRRGHQAGAWQSAAATGDDLLGGVVVPLERRNSAGAVHLDQGLQKRSAGGSSGSRRPTLSLLGRSIYDSLQFDQQKIPPPAKTKKLGKKARGGCH